jgi:hypothetical protein
MHNAHSISGDMTGLFLIATNWTSLLLSIHPIATEWLQILGLAFGVIASLVVVVDHCMKIHWKWKQYRKAAKERKAEKEGTNGQK